MDNQYPMVYVNKMAKEMDKVVGEKLRNEILKGCENLTSKDNKEKRADAMKCVMSNMELLLEEKDIIQIREECACKPQKFIKVVNKIKSDTINYNERLKKLQDTGFAGAVTKENENTFRVEFRTNYCFCGMVGKSKTNIPLSWCHCCKEHIKWLYEKTLEREFSVGLVTSIIAGGEDCVFMMSQK
ncbi:DUF6144 family protein [Vallitalea okinawensis]|uniref:DUF6144 family protein n=1 Tax=Vallitalea okinawensis TaxID=2078660 RepID=UPI000CFB57C6|nr:DUF6144 family protein [Vallitalea okinawensis]